MTEELDNPIMEPSEVFYGSDNSDNVEAPEETGTVALEKAPEETVVDSEELGTDGSGAEEGEGSLVYEIDGEEVAQETILEWKQGHLRQADYTQKTQGIADKVRSETSKKVAETLGDLGDKASTLIEQAESLEALLAEVEGGVNLAELREEDYEEYQKTKETIDNRRAKVEKVRSDARKALEEANTAQVAQEQVRLYEAMPQWTDDTGKPTVKREEDFKLINDYARDAGYTAEEFGMMANHKMILTLLEAAQYRKLKEKTTQDKKVKVAPKLVKPTQKSTKENEPRSAEEIMYGKAG